MFQMKKCFECLRLSQAPDTLQPASTMDAEQPEASGSVLPDFATDTYVGTEAVVIE
jgi:hypothetical protein